MPVEARAALIDSLLESLDAQVDEEAEALWRHEIYRRLQEMDGGAVKLISLERRAAASLGSIATLTSRTVYIYPAAPEEGEAAAYSYVERSRRAAERFLNELGTGHRSYF